MFTKEIALWCSKTMETTGSATSPNNTSWIDISIYVRCGFLSPQLQRVFSFFLPLPLQQPHNTRTTSTTEVSLHYPKQGMIIMENPSKLPATCAACLMLDPPPVKKMGPHFMIPYSSNPQRKGYTPNPHSTHPFTHQATERLQLHRGLRASARNFPMLSGHLYVAADSWTNNTRKLSSLPLSALGLGNNPFPIFSYFEHKGSVGCVEKGTGWNPGSFHRLWLKNQLFDFQVISWLDKIGVSYNKIEQKQLRMRMGGDIHWMVDWSFAEKASCPIWWNPVQAEDCPEGHDG